MALTSASYGLRWAGFLANMNSGWKRTPRRKPSLASPSITSTIRPETRPVTRSCSPSSPAPDCEGTRRRRPPPRRPPRPRFPAKARRCGRRHGRTRPARPDSVAWRALGQAPPYATLSSSMPRQTPRIGLPLRRAARTRAISNASRTGSWSPSPSRGGLAAVRRRSDVGAARDDERVQLIRIPLGRILVGLATAGSTTGSPPA